MFLVRKINRAKWQSKHGVKNGEIPADAVTAELRTSENALSFWLCDRSDRASVCEAALAIAAGFDRPDKIDVVWFPVSKLEDEGLQLVDTEGRTPVKSWVEKHKDATSLDYSRLGTIADCVKRAIQQGNWLRLTRKEVLQLLRDTAQKGELAFDQLSDKLRAGLSDTAPNSL
jgi:hypothetical protein